MRCFIGLEVQDPLFSSILDITHHWDSPPADFHKHTYPHITIVPPFDTKNANELISRLTQATLAFPQFDASYAKINAFRRRIVHIEVESNGLIELRAKLFEVGRGVFEYQEEYPIYRAHTTVAYMRDPMTDAEFQALKTSLETRLKLPQHQTVISINLYGREKPNMDYSIITKLMLKNS